MKSLDWLAQDVPLFRALEFHFRDIETNLEYKLKAPAMRILTGTDLHKMIISEKQYGVYSFSAALDQLKNKEEAITLKNIVKTEPALYFDLRDSST